ncbi:ABC transporter substrate-binding protein [Candidatus Saccharibacteria bacterium]|nr:ABC transporter substrate-binding protein [Candidatus Saccharibacteria bacterium]
MKNVTGKRGQKIIKKLSRFSKKAGESGREHIQENLVERVDHIKNVRLLILEWSLLVLAIIMLSVTQAFWYAESYSIESWGKGGTYTEATLGKVNSLNPLFASTSSEKALSKLMFATLSAPDYSGHIGLNLAESIRTDDGANTWTVKLRKGATWSDGEPVTNKDVLYTVSVLQDPSVNSSYSSNLSKVEVSEKDGALLFTLPTAYANFPSALDFPILPEHILGDVKPSLLLEDSFSLSPVTSGPFSYNASQNVGTEGEKIVYLTPNKSYFGGAPLLDSFAIHAFTTEEDIVDAVKTGLVTATAELSPTDAEELITNTITERQAAISSGVYAFFNTTGDIFNNKSLRKAVQMGLDMRSLRAPTGEEVALSYPLLKSQTTIPEKDYPALPDYNPKEAKEAVEGANVERPINLVAVNTGYIPAVAENLKYQLEQLGFKVELHIYDFDQDFLLTIIRPRDYDILVQEIGLGADPDLFAYYHSSQATAGGLNLSNYNNALASDLLLAARGTMDQEIRNAKYSAFLKLWVDDAPAIGIYQANMSYYVNKNVRSFSAENHLVTAIDRFEDVSFWSTQKVTKNRTP